MTSITNPFSIVNTFYSRNAGLNKVFLAIGIITCIAFSYWCSVPQNVCSSTLQVHKGCTISEVFTSESYERNFDRTCELTYEHSYQQKHESNVRLNKAIRNISSSTDQSIVSDHNTVVAKQNERQSENLSDGNRNHTGKLQQRRSKSKSNRISKGVRRDRKPSRFPWKKISNLLNKSKAIKRYVRSHNVRSVPHSSALKTILSFDYHNYLKNQNL